MSGVPDFGHNEFKHKVQFGLYCGDILLGMHWLNANKEDVFQNNKNDLITLVLTTVSQEICHNFKRLQDLLPHLSPNKSITYLILINTLLFFLNSNFIKIDILSAL